MSENSKGEVKKEIREKEVYLGDQIALGLLLGFMVVVGFILFGNTMLHNHHHHHRGEISAIGALRTIVMAQQQFRILRKKTGNNRPLYGNFSELNSHEMVDAAFVNGYKSGYNFTMTLLKDKTKFEVHASPVSERDGKRMFFTNQKGRVTFSTTSLPNATSTGVE